TESAWKHFTGEVESRDYVGGEPESFAGIISRSAFGEAMRAYGRKEPEPGPEPGHDRLEEGVRPENHPKWIF
ncbi:MAG: hypothetical protein JRM99_05160, partial [Nitrososphaerota archaeon]|nr:hypothetical protein [Nitrososphaerota archaeon]